MSSVSAKTLVPVSVPQQQATDTPKTLSKTGAKKSHKSKLKAKSKRYFDAESETQKPSGDAKAGQRHRPDPKNKSKGTKRKRETENHNKPNKQKKTRDRQHSQLDIGEEAGYLEYDEDDVVNRLSQTEIVKAVDVTSATKYFQLNLTDFGPYNVDYSRNGRHMLLGGQRGHVAAFDWQTKSLSCEINVDPVSCVQWLHQETSFAVGHPNSVSFYDNEGLELHDLTNLDAVLKMQFLPHHMLLVTSNAKGFLAYTDVSMGTRVAGHCTGMGRLDVMAHNPTNAVIHLGHASGVVSLWQPSLKKPIKKILTHKAPVKALAIDSSGNYMATSGVDKRVKVFDLRTDKLLNKTHIPMGASSLCFSQKGLLAAAMGNTTQVYKDCWRTGELSPYLSHVCNGSIKRVQFCPYEDVLGVGYERGFTSLIVPGSGEPNLDSLLNPNASKKTRQNNEVRLLLDKLQPEMIGLTNWVTVVNGSASISKRPPAATVKLGLKQKEELQREKTRNAQKDRKETPSKTDKTNPLSRFKKPVV